MRPFPILRLGPTVWAADLKPEHFDEPAGVADPKAYVERHRQHFPHLHEQVIEQWVYKHWVSSPYRHVPLVEMRSALTSWTTADFLAQVGVRNDYSDEIGESDQVKRHWQRLLELRPFKGMWETGTWDFPPLVLHNPAGFFDDTGALLAQTHWLIEGHQRYRGLNYLRYKGRAQEKHAVYVMDWPGGLPT